MLDRFTLIMDLFERPDTIHTREQVTQLTGLPRSTTYRILEHLTRLNWLERAGRGFRLGYRSLGIGGRELGHNALRAAAAPVLHNLATHTKLVVHLTVLNGTSVHYLDKVGGPNAARVPSRVGGRAPAHCTAAGKAMLSRLSPEYIDLAYSSGVMRCTSKSVGSLAELHRELVHNRNTDSPAYEFGEYISALGCVAASFHPTTGPLGAISVAATEQTVLHRVAPLVQRAARAISDAMLRAEAHSAEALGEVR
ncbi:IclR family transcriptional regulator [Nocardia sp. NPDC004711]